jgi:hypothetical protein
MTTDDEYDPSVRLAPPPGGTPGVQPVSAIELTFEIPVYVTHEQWKRLREITSEIIEAPYNTPTDGVHWLCSEGSKPRWSNVDAQFMGKAVDPAAPETGEPTFDSSIHVMESAARGFVTDKERVRVLAQRAKAASKPPSLTEYEELVQLRAKASRKCSTCSKWTEDQSNVGFGACSNFDGHIFGSRFHCAVWEQRV